jgi:hypothetical protein
MDSSAPNSSSHSASPSPADGPSAPPAGPSFVERVWPVVKPLVEWAGLQSKVWVPFLTTPVERARQVTYGARESRDGTKWDVTLPAQCWQCGTKQGLRSREYELDTRSFEAPVGILACAAGLSLFMFILSVWLGSWMCFFASLLLLVGGGAMMFVKSWPERVRLVVSTCPNHADDLRCPEFVVYENEFQVFLATPQLADAARSELASKRRAGGRYAPDDHAPAASPTAAAATPRPAAGPAPQAYKRGELPPIKLDD